MLYLTQRYLLGVSALGFLVMSGIIFLPFFKPEMFPNLTRMESFLPMHDLFLVAGTAVSILTIMSVHPWITDGQELRYMDSPLSHPGFHGILFVVIILTPLYYYLYTLENQNWQVERLLTTIIYLLKITAGAGALIVLGFYIMRAKARETARLKRLRQKKQAEYDEAFA